MSKLLLLLIALAIPGCGAVDKATAELSGKPAEVCHDNVVYLQFTSGVTPKYGVNSLVVTCGE